MPIGIGTIVAGGAAILGAGATIIASNKASHAQTEAANTAAATEQHNADQNNQLARDMYTQNAARLDPYSQMGLAAGDQYMGILMGPSAGHHSSGWAPVPWTATPPPLSGTPSALAPYGQTDAHHMTAAESAHFNSLPPEQQSGYINSLTGAPTNALAPVVQQHAAQAVAAGADPAAVAQRAAQYGVAV